MDPDPTEYLVQSIEMKREDKTPYDSMKSMWIPCPKKGGYKEGLLESGDLEDEGSKCLVAVAPGKFIQCKDMVDLTFLNDVSVFWNLKTCYQAKMIHTYSGLFVDVVNPHKRYPILSYLLEPPLTALITHKLKCNGVLEGMGRVSKQVRFEYKRAGAASVSSVKLKKR